MIIHHQDGSKAVIETLVKGVITKQGKVLLCYKSPASSAKGIIEFTGAEVTAFLGAARGRAAVNDADIFSQFAGIKGL